jgi:protein-disulfide isomerase
MSRFLRLPLIAALAIGAVPAWASGFSTAQRAEIVGIVREALRTDPSILREAIEVLRADEAAQEQVANKSALAMAREQLVTPNDPVGGNPQGNVTIIEFFDVRCGYCKRLDPALARVIAEDRNIRRIYKDLPILGPASVLGAKAALAARKQNAYEKMREALIRGPSDLSPAFIQAEARRLGLDAERLVRDMDDPGVQAIIDANLALAGVLGIRGTPALVIGEELVPGAVPVEELRRLVDKARGRKG